MAKTEIPRLLLRMDRAEIEGPAACKDKVLHFAEIFRERKRDNTSGGLIRVALYSGDFWCRQFFSGESMKTAGEYYRKCDTRAADSNKNW